MNNIEEKYLLLKKLIVEERILLLPHKRYRGIRQSYVYSRCGISLKYFENAYNKGNIVLEIVETGQIVGYPLSWKTVLEQI